MRTSVSLRRSPSHHLFICYSLLCSSQHIPTRHSLNFSPSSPLPSMLRTLSLGLVGALVALGCCPSSVRAHDHGNETVESQVLGLGSSHYNTLVQAWDASFTSAHASERFRGQLLFDGSLDEGARAALPRVKGAKTNASFLVTDMPLSDAERQGMVEEGGDFLEMPAALTACVLVYNLPGLATPLQLTGPLMAQILTGKISWWNDTALAEYNPALNATDSAYAHRIEVVVRGATTTTSWQLTDFLAREAGDQWVQGRTQTPAFAPGATTKDDGKVLANYVAATPFTFGYNKYRTASNAGVAVASVRNRAGAFVAPSPAAIQAAAAGYSPYPALDASHSETFIGATDAPAAYPLANVMYIMTYAKFRSDGAAAPAFFEFVAGDEAMAAMPAGYIAVPAALREKNAAAAKAMQERPSGLNGASGAARPFAVLVAAALGAVAWAAAGL